MVVALLRRLAARLRGSGGSDDEDSRFVPSTLDASVRYAHGSPDGDGERELARLDAEGRRLEEQRDR